MRLYLVCKVLVILFLVRIFCAGFIFTPVNYERFTDSGLFPLIKAIFYSDLAVKMVMNVPFGPDLGPVSVFILWASVTFILTL